MFSFRLITNEKVKVKQWARTIDSLREEGWLNDTTSISFFAETTKYKKKKGTKDDETNGN